MVHRTKERFPQTHVKAITVVEAAESELMQNGLNICSDCANCRMKQAVSLFLILNSFSNSAGSCFICQ